MKPGYKSFLAGLPLLLLPVLDSGPVLAESPEDRGLAIERERDRRDSGWGDAQSALTMVLRNSQGEESVRRLRNRFLERTEDGDWALIVFDEPRDVAGTALLSYTHKTGPDDQWLYLPALKRVKRIASDNKSGPFMGSEFAYEDIASQEIEKYTYKYLRNETVAGVEHFVLERYPTDPKSGYTRQVVWLDKEEYRPQKIEYYDRKGSHLKTLAFSEYHAYAGRDGGRYWRAHRMDMQNHQTGKSTALAFSGFRFGTGLTDRDFDQTSLREAR